MEYKEVLNIKDYVLIEVINNRYNYERCGYEVWRKNVSIESSKWGSCGWTFLNLLSAIDFLNKRIKEQR